LLVSDLPKETISELSQDLFDIAHYPSVTDKASEVDEASRKTLGLIEHQSLIMTHAVRSIN
jgi:hypothetical protein